MPTMMSEKMLWRATDKRLRALGQGPAGRKEKEFCRDMEWVSDHLKELLVDKREAIEGFVATAVHAITSLRQVGLSSSGPGPLVELNPGDDDRWSLLKDLDSLANQGPSKWSPISARTTRPVGFNVSGGRAPERRVLELSIDHQMSFRALSAALRAAWPTLYANGMVRRSRPLGERSITLARHVCIRSSPGTTSKEWLISWNRKWRNRPDWRYKDVRALVTALHRAEAELTGDRHGLAWFYDPLARLTAEELNQLADAGDRHAERLRDRRMAEGFASIRKAGIRVVAGRGRRKEKRNGRKTRKR